MVSVHLEDMARETGISLVGVAPVGADLHWQKYCDWIDRGYAADMTYLTRSDAVRKRQDPRRILPSTRAVLVVAASYGQGEIPQPEPFMGLVSRYAWREDYHNGLLSSLKALVHRISFAAGTPVEARCYVDTGPVLERAWAQVAGLGWIGKNTCLISPKLGSFIFLGVALVNLDLEVPPEQVTPSCGTCTKCLDACPTGALVAPGVLDANRCLSYLTIENRGEIPRDIRPLLGNHVFGCDICQDVCPWNTRMKKVEPATDPVTVTLDLRELLEMDVDMFRQRFRHSPLWRAKPEGLARNAAVVLGNQRHPAVTDYVRMMAVKHPSRLVNKHLLWAVQQHDEA